MDFKRDFLSTVLHGGWALLIFKPFEKPMVENHKPFVLFPLHKQPEASIDVLGSYYSNQLELIKNISRSLPITHELYVKEHRNSIGDRSLNFYRQLKRIPGVKLIDPFIDANELLAKADIVITVSGTMAYEAALHGIPAITLSDMFFGKILANNGKGISFIQLNEILTNRQSYRPSKEKLIKFLAYIHANSFIGNISDPWSDPSCMEKENIERVVNAFSVLINSLDKSNKQTG